MAHKWAKSLRHHCRLGDPHRFRAGGKSEVAHFGQSGYVTPAVSGIPTASERVGKAKVAHLWAKWLRHPCRLGDPHRFRAGGTIGSGPLVGKVATAPLPCRGSPQLQSGGQNQKLPAYGQSGYVTPAVSGIPTAVERGPNQKWPTCGQSGYVAHAVSGIPTASQRGGGGITSGPLVGKVATSPLPSRGSPGISTASERVRKSEVAHLWAKWLRHPCRLGDSHRFRAGGKIKSGPQVGKVAMSPPPSRGSPPLQSGGRNQKWPTYGQSGYVTLAVSGIPTTSERVGKSEVAHKWAKSLRHHCRLGDPYRCRGGGKIRSGPLWAKRLRHPCRLGDLHRFRVGRKIKSGPQVGKVARSPLPSRGSPPLPSGWENQKWPTCGQSGYVTRAVSGIPTTA